MRILAALLLCVSLAKSQDETVRYSYQNEHATPAKHIEVIYHQGNAYIKLDCGPGYEPYIGYWRNGRELWLEGVRLGRESDDYVLYSIPMGKRITATDVSTGVMTFFYPVRIGGEELQSLAIKGDSLILTVNGRKFVAREAK